MSGMRRLWTLWILIFLADFRCVPLQAQSFRLEVEQITRGPEYHHFFGYIGQSLTTPWNQSGKYLLTLRAKFHDRRARADEAADICLVDTTDNYRVIPIESTLAWNFQQGTMFYWHPKNPENQFFFNDRDPETQRIFTVLYDIEKRKRIREYRFEDVPVANGGVSPTGEFFLAINYARMARLRPVTGYPGTLDPTAHELAPDNDGIFRVEIESGQRQLLVSFHQLRELARSRFTEALGRNDRPQTEDVAVNWLEKLDEMGFYINHSLSSRDGEHVYFFARTRYEDKEIAVNVPCSMTSTGMQLRSHAYIGGHPEWDEGTIVIGALDDRQVLYDIQLGKIVGQIGKPGDFPSPSDDVSLARDPNWFANGFDTHERGSLEYIVMRRSDGAKARSQPIFRGADPIYHRGDLRIDPAPRWNRTSNALLVPGMTSDNTRQLHLIRVVPN